MELQLVTDEVLIVIFLSSHGLNPPTQGKDGISKQGVFFVEPGQQAVSQLAHLKLPLLLELMVS